jgi:broad specificity phosphatase PhoE
MTVPHTSRVALIAHASTDAVRAAWFPDDEPLDRYGAAAVRDQFQPGRPLARCSPVRRCVQTAAGLGYGVAPDEGLRPWDLGSWKGRSLDEVAAAESAAVAQWTSDADFAPHGGESLTRLIERMAAWLDERGADEGPRIVAVTDPALIRAAIVHTLGGWAPAFWRIDVGPLDRVDIHGRAGAWSLRALRPQREAVTRRPPLP